MEIKIIHKEVNNEKHENIIRLFKENHFLITQDLESIYFRRKKVIENDIGDKFALLRLIQVQGKIVINKKSTQINLNFNRHLIFIGISLIFPFVALIIINGLEFYYAIFFYLLSFLVWFNISKSIIRNKITRFFE